jgi:hypothetical protein
MIKALENWDTKNGKSIRVVVRDANGRFIDNTSLASLIK